VKIKTYIQNWFKKKPTPKKEAVLFLNENIRKLKGEELENIKFTIRNYVGDDILTRLISSKANQIKDDAIVKCHSLLPEGGHASEEIIRKAGLIMLTSTYKIKGLEELVDEIKFFAKKESSTDPVVNPHESI